MDLQFPYLFAVLVILVSLKSLIIPKSKRGCSKLPPGPRQLPVIGNLHQLAAAGPLIHRSLRDLANKYGPLMHLKLGEVHTIVGSTPEMAKHIMRTHDLIFANRPPLLAAKICAYDFKDIAFAPHGKYWRQMRKLCVSELLSADSVRSFRSIREEEASNLIKGISGNGGELVNLSEKVMAMTFAITARAAFGSKCKDQAEFKQVAAELMRLGSGFCLADLYPSKKLLSVVSGLRIALEKQFKKSDRILRKIIQDRKHIRATTKDGKGDAEESLLDVLLSAQECGEFCIEDNHLKAVLMDVFIGGAETSSSTVEWAMSEMMKNPRVMREAQEEVRQVFKGRQKVDEAGVHELKYLKMVVKETMRLHPVAPLLLPRESSQRCEIDGHEIPAKSRVIVNAWAINRDPRFWEEAERFNPERFLSSQVDYNGTYFEYIPFGAGRRMCPGILFAMPNVELPLAQLLFHFDWKLPNGMEGETLDMTESFGVSVGRKNELVLLPTVRILLVAALQFRFNIFGQLAPVVTDLFLKIYQLALVTLFLDLFSC